MFTSLVQCHITCNVVVVIPPQLTISGNEAFIIRTQLEGLRTHIMVKKIRLCCHGFSIHLVCMVRICTRVVLLNWCALFRIVYLKKVN